MKGKPRLECPHCGAIFHKSRLACPECGSDAETGWRDAADIDYLSTEIPDYYEEPAPQRQGRQIVYWLAAVLALVAMIVFAIIA